MLLTPISLMLCTSNTLPPNSSSKRLLTASLCRPWWHQLLWCALLCLQRCVWAPALPVTRCLPIIALSGSSRSQTHAMSVGLTSWHFFRLELFHLTQTRTFFPRLGLRIAAASKFPDSLMTNLRHSWGLPRRQPQSGGSLLEACGALT